MILASLHHLAGDSLYHHLLAGSSLLYYLLMVGAAMESLVYSEDGDVLG